MPLVQSQGAINFMKRLFILPLRVSILFVAICIIIASCSTASNGENEQVARVATVTPLPGEATATAAPPTSTIAPSPSPDPLTSSPDMLEGRRMLDAGEFDQAIAAYQRALAEHRGNETIRDSLGQAYLAWGQAMLSSAEGKTELVNNARSKFTDGLVIAPETSSIHQALQIEQQKAQGYVEGSLAMEELLVLDEQDADLQERLVLAEQALKDFATTFELQPDYQLIAWRYGRTYLLLAKVEETLGDMSAEEGKAMLERARTHCQAAADLLDAGNDEELTERATRCVNRIAGILEPTPTRTRVTTPPSTNNPQLVIVPDVRGSDVGLARSWLEGQGFQIAVTPLPSEQVGDLCNGWVSYTEPGKGSMVRPGSMIRLYYRGFDTPNPPGCP